jgi:hypothetical protein
VIDQDEQLRSITARRKPKDRTPGRLGPFLEAYVTEQVAPKYRQFSSVEQAWHQVISDELAQHCRCDGVSGGQIKIVVDSPSYMYKLQAMSVELIEKLEHICKRPRIQKIKFVPGFAKPQKDSGS